MEINLFKVPNLKVEQGCLLAAITKINLEQIMDKGFIIMVANNYIKSQVVGLIRNFIDNLVRLEQVERKVSQLIAIKMAMISQLLIHLNLHHNFIKVVDNSLVIQTVLILLRVLVVNFNFRSFINLNYN